MGLKAFLERCTGLNVISKRLNCRMPAFHVSTLSTLSVPLPAKTTLLLNDCHSIVCRGRCKPSLGSSRFCDSQLHSTDRLFSQHSCEPAEQLRWHLARSVTSRHLAMPIASPWTQVCVTTPCER
jgi:hypothetical protein